MIFDSHMLAMASENKFSKVFEIGFKTFITPVIKRNKYMVIKTQDDDYVNKHLGIPEKNTKFISFGTDTALFRPDTNVRKVFIEKHKLDDDAFIIVSTGKLSESKGGMLLADCVREPFKTRRQVVVVIVANLNGEYETMVKDKLNKSNNKVIYYPVQNYLDLPQFYQIADVTVFPKQCSMSFYDAQSCASIVITEKGNVNEQRCSHGNGFCFEQGNVDDFRKMIQKLIDMDPTDFQRMKNNGLHYVTDNYSYEKIAAEYTQQMELAIQRFMK